MTHARIPDAASLDALHADVLEHIRTFLDGRETARDLDAWLLDATWNMRLQSDPATRSLVGRVGRYLTEYAKGHRSDENLWHALLEILAETPRRLKFAGYVPMASPVQVSAMVAVAPGSLSARRTLLAAHV